MDLFLLGCIPARAFLAVLPVYLEPVYLQIFSLVLFAISFSFLFLYFTGSRMKAFESSTGITWWADYRLLHGLLYLGAGIYAYQQKPENVLNTLTIDLLFGIFVWLMK
jgi:hypothetical protein